MLRQWLGRLDKNKNDSLIEQFHEEMLGIYQRAKTEAGYNATAFGEMLHEHGGLESAKILLHKENVSGRYTYRLLLMPLYLRGRLDITVEAVIHDNPKWHPLFTPEELAISASRLAAHHYPGIHTHKILYPDWQEEYRAAISELNCERILERVTKAEAALLGRLQTISQCSDHREEQQAIYDALATLQFVLRDRLGLPDPGEFTAPF